MRENIRIAIVMTVVTTIIFGLVYPLVVTGLAHLFFPAQANGELIVRNGQVIGSRLIAQPFSSDRYFHPRPSAAGTGYDPVAAGGSASNLGPTNRQLLDRVKGDVEKLHAENPGAAVPVDLVTTSASGLDPDISPAAAEFQIPRVARARKISPDELRALVAKHTQGRQLGLLGEPRVNVLELNLDLDARPAGAAKGICTFLLKDRGGEILRLPSSGSLRMTPPVFASMEETAVCPSPSS